MKNKTIKKALVTLLVTMMTVCQVHALPSVTNTLNVVKDKVTVTAENGVVVEDAVLTVVTTVETEVNEKGEEKKETVIVNEIPETAHKQIETLNHAMEEAIKTEKPEKFTEVIQNMIEAEQIEVADENDTFKVENMKPLSEVHDVILMDSEGNVLKNVKDVDVKIEVQSLIEGMGEVRIMHYDIELEKWIIIKPEVNYEEKTLEFHLNNAGPIMVVYVPAEEK